MTRRWLLALVGCWIGLAPAWCDEPPAAKMAFDSSQDRAVIEAVLHDLLTHRESPLARGMRNKQLLFTQTEPGDRFGLDTLIDPDYEKGWKKLPRGQFADARKAAKQLMQRSAAKDAFKPFAPDDPRILFHTAEQVIETRKKEFFAQIFRVSPPGYARDQKIALVHLWFPWSIHVGVATYMLVRRDDQWVISIRQIIYYA